MKYKELKLEFLEDIVDTQEYKSLMLPRFFPIIYSQYIKYGFAIVEELVDVIIYNNDYSRNINFYTPYYTNTLHCFDYSVLSRSSTELLHNNLIDLFISFLDNGYYIQYFVDTFYVSNYTENYKQDHCEHVALIYGYDLEKQAFLVLDYFDFYKLDKQLISFKEIMISNEHYKIKKNDGIDCSGNSCMVEAFKLDPQMARKPNVDILKQKISMFINNTYLDTYEGISYGIQMFDIMAQRLKDEDYAPIKHFSFIMSHIFLMSVRMKILYEYFKEKRYIDLKEMFDDLYTESRVLKNKYIKYTITNNQSLKNSIVEDLLNLKSSYKDKLELVINNN